MSASKRSLLAAIGDRFLDRVRVAEVNAVSANFRYIDLESDAFRRRALAPGDKLQLDSGGWNFRTYTPVSLDAETGRLGILTYLHGRGPGSAWAARARPGDELRAFGPRRSFRLPEPEFPLVVFGDETSIAAVAALQRGRAALPVARVFLEARDPAEVSAIVTDMGLRSVEVHARAESGPVSESVLAALLETARSPSRVLLTGRAESIREVRARLRAEGVPLSRVTTKPYWAEGRRGLD